MKNIQAIGIIASILGLAGMIVYKFDFGNASLPSILSLIVFVIGLYIALTRA